MDGHAVFKHTCVRRRSNSSTWMGMHACMWCSSTYGVEPLELACLGPGLLQLRLQLHPVHSPVHMMVG